MRPDRGKKESASIEPGVPHRSGWILHIICTVTNEWFVAHNSILDVGNVCAVFLLVLFLMRLSTPFLTLIIHFNERRRKKNEVSHTKALEKVPFLGTGSHFFISLVPGKRRNWWLPISLLPFNPAQAMVQLWIERSSKRKKAFYGYPRNIRTNVSFYRGEYGLLSKAPEKFF